MKAARVAVVLAVAAQAAVLAWMAGEREWILHTGQVVLLRTAPVDPRDLFRGDFVRLDYEVNHVPLPARAEPPGNDQPAQRRHEVVYTRLQPTGEGLFEAAGTSTDRPRDGLFLRGRTEEGWRVGASDAVVRYGIEQYYVEQGEGRKIEERRGARNTLQVPMEVEVAVSGSGTAVIRGYRWARLGMQLEVVRRGAPRRPNAPPPPGPLSPKLRVTLANAADTPLAIADFGDHCAFHLVPLPGQTSGVRAVEAASCTGATATASDVITLAPGQAQTVEIDLSEPRWFVLNRDGKQVETGTVDAFTRYRIEYRAPPPEALKETPALWRGRLSSAAFNGAGSVD